MVHSHTHTEPYPSPTDVAQAPDPAWHYVIVSLQARGARAAQLPHRRRRDHRGARRRRPETESRQDSIRLIGVGDRPPDVRGGDRPFESVLDLIGNTPIVDVSVLSPNPDVRILAKLEGQNPFGSVKDRIAKSMIEQAEKDGRLHARPDDPRAVVGQHRHRPGGDRPAQGLPDQDPDARERVDRAPPDARGVRRRDHPHARRRGLQRRRAPGPGAGRRAPRVVLPLPVRQRRQPAAHYEGTGPEIWRDCPEITHFVAGLGTSGTLMGIGRFLKEQNPDIKIIAVEPPLGERVEGLRNLDEGYIPPVFENWHGFELLDRKRVVRPRESIEWTRRLVNECGVFAGISSRRRAGRRGQGGRARSTRARSCSSSATAAGSTCRPAPTPTTSTPPRSRPRGSSTSRSPPARGTVSVGWCE